ncbi:amino acid permease [Neobacillus drentensis]|uniref:amino acid permease n=1 Tax=Neobacillus drentensis TaxID=220684 RepID=UPI001F487F04|nr:amino acid permease [Neobacillus drentensis]ULT58771.1 amino acid permease [Neobacillus drentensis]
MSDKVHLESYEKEDLKRDLSNRHIQMIAIGGAIGTGLFYGSSWAISQGGPAILLMYLIVGIAIYFIMRALGEMAVEEPVSGTYVSYANRYIHRFAGFLSGWNAFIFLIATSAADLNALGKYVQFWFPNIPVWLSALAVVMIMFTINIIGVSIYGETEFWLSLIKVTAIVFMIIFGALMIIFGVGNHGNPVGVGNLVNHGGFFSTGMNGFILSIVMVAFAFGGVENLGFAAGEAKNVKTTIPKAVNAVFWRIMIFYVGAIFILVTIFPWNTAGSKGSPFVEIFTKMNIPAAASIMNLVVISAVLSAVNSSIFANTRTFYNLALQKNAPAILGKVNRKNIPFAGVILVFASMLFGVLMNFLMPEKVFSLFASVTVFGLICNWSAILISHLKFRKIKIKNNEVDKLTYKMPFYPYSNYFGLFFMAVVIVCMGFLPDERMSLVVSAVWVVIVFIAYKFYTKKDTGKDITNDTDITKDTLEDFGG